MRSVLEIDIEKRGIGKGVYIYGWALGIGSGNRNRNPNGDRELVAGPTHQVTETVRRSGIGGSGEERRYRTIESSALVAAYTERKFIVLYKLFKGFKIKYYMR